MDSPVKCGNGYGYGYGNSKPQMSYHRQSTESVTTVVTEINRMTVNDKPCYGGGGAQKQACKVEAFEEHDEGYNGTVAVHAKHDEYKEKEKYGEVVDAEYGAHYGAGAALKKQGYNYTKEACEESNAGYGAHHGGAGAAVQRYAYDHQAVYGGAIGAAAQQPAYKQKDAASKTNGSRQKVYGYGEAVDAAGAGYGAHYGVGAGAGQQHGYQKDAYGTGYGAATAVGKAKKNGYQYQEAYGGTDAGGYGGAHYGGGGAVQQYGYGGATAGGKVKQSGYQYQEAYGGTDAGGYGAHYGGGAAAAAVQKHGYRQDVHESETESESEGDESDCEEAFSPRGGGRLQGGVQHSYGAYKQDMQGAGNLGGVRRYESYESREELGGGRRYESYKSTVQYNGGGHATCPPIKNRHLLRYGA